MGDGPMTGGARGLCDPASSGYDPRFTGRLGYGRSLGLRRGFRGGLGGTGAGRGRGLGRGYGSPYPVGAGYPLSTADAMDMLRADADFMQKSLEAINKRMDELEKRSSEES